MPNPISEITEAGLQSFYKRNNTFTKGKAYYKARCVTNLQIVHLSENHSSIQAQVHSTNLYKVLIELKNTKHTIKLRSQCSCPLQSHCKHIVAVLLQAIDDKQAIKATTNTISATGVISQPNNSDQQDIQRWLKQLQHAITVTSVTPAITDESHGLYYVLVKIAHDQWQIGVEPLLIRRLKTGGLGAAKKYSPTAYMQQKHLSPLDKELLTLLSDLKRINCYQANSPMFCLTGATGEEMLLKLINTGRCHWQSAKNPALTLAEPKTLTLNWVIDNQGKQKLVYNELAQHATFFIIKHLWYLDTSSAICNILHTAFTHNVAKLLLSAPAIPPNQVVEVAKFIKQHNDLAAIKTPQALTIKQINHIKPVPHLRLFQASIQEYTNKFSPATTTLKALADVFFVYGDSKVAWHDTNTRINTVANNQLRTIIRQQAWERKAVQTLMKYDAVTIGSMAELYHSTANSTWYNSFLLESDLIDPLEFSKNIIPKLRKTGWQIEFAADYPYQISDDPIDEWYSAIHEDNSANAWFGLELGITVKGENINLLPVLQNMLQQLQAQQQPLTVTDKTKAIYARLPNGKYMSLPAHRIKNLLNVLIELYDKDSLSNKQELRLSRLHASRLLELDAAMGATQLRWIGGEHLRDIGRKLVNFSGIEQTVVPPQFHTTLRPYQLDGLSWLQFLRQYEFGGILADDMGLGKTVQALAHITVEKTSGRMQQPCLVVAPTSLMFNWQTEAKRFAPELKVLLLHGGSRKEQFANLASYDLILTTYQLIVRDKQFLLKQHFYLLILDEAQFIKNAKSQAALVALQLNASHRLCLTGTPIENHMGELWSLFNFMMPGLLGKQQSFQRLFQTPIEKHANQERRQHLHRRIAPFLLRRTKDTVVKELPDKVEMIRHVALAGEQRDIYETVRITMQEKIKKEIAKLGFKRSHIVILDALLKLRQICCDPRLLKVKLAQQKSGKSAKLELLMTLLPNLVAEGRRILVFSQFTTMLALIEQEINQANIPYVKLTGKTKNRATPVQQFQTGEIPLFLISLKAGGTGLNLTAADVVIHYDPWWNPAVENQATDRAHRIGQEKTVFVYKFVAKDTVEEKILAMQQRKKELMAGLFADKATSKLVLSEQDLQGLFAEF
jgi:SNF2 family DNA or RNA helicase